VIVADVTARLVSATPLPTRLKVVVPPPPVIVKARAPLRLALKVMLAPFEVMLLAPVKLTGLENVSGLAPETVMLFPIWMRIALATLRFVKGVLPPTMPVKVTVPDPADNVRD
jgi:hypothetical protein